MQTPKPKKIGRPVLPKGDAKAKIVPVRFKPDEIAKITKAAKSRKLTVSEWIRTTLSEAIQ